MSDAKYLMEASFNSQPPEGGWWPSCVSTGTTKPFQLTAARRRLALWSAGALLYSCVSTHSRPKAAGVLPLPLLDSQSVSTHSRPKAAGSERLGYRLYTGCFNSQPPEGGWAFLYHMIFSPMPFQLTAARRRLVKGWALRWGCMVFQLTAARRRLADATTGGGCDEFVSTHSRPKAAGRL